MSNNLSTFATFVVIIVLLVSRESWWQTNKQKHIRIYLRACVHACVCVFPFKKILQWKEDENIMRP